MKNCSPVLIPVVLIIALALSLLTVGASEGTAPARDESPLEDAMSTIKSKLRKVKRALRAEDSAAALDGIVALEEAALAAKKLEPSMATKEKDESKKAALVKDFRLRVIDLIAEMLKVEKALLAGDLEAASNGVKMLQKIEHDGHERFEVDDH